MFLNLKIKENPLSKYQTVSWDHYIKIGGGGGGGYALSALNNFCMDERSATFPWHFYASKTRQRKIGEQRTFYRHFCKRKQKKPDITESTWSSATVAEATPCSVMQEAPNASNYLMYHHTWLRAGARRVATTPPLAPRCAMHLPTPLINPQ